VAVIAVAGRIGAGKSAIADGAATAVGGSRRSFGGAVREIAENRGLPTDRTSLQDLGEQTIADEGWTEFVSRVLAGDLKIVVIDGVRHIAAAEALRAVAPRDGFLLVFVDASFERRLDRVSSREGITRAELEAADQHPNEAEVLALRGFADIVIDNERDGPEALAEAIETIVTASRALRG
jgi:dephospho-CoA kinase